LQAAALAAPVQERLAAFRCPAPEPTRLDERQDAMGEATARLKQLRGCFDRAKKRLEALPETGLSEAGQPYIQEVAEALQSFAAWFGELTFDHYSISGSARRVHVALTGFDAIADWVGLHRSQQFADDLSGQMAELVEQSEGLDDAVMAAFLVERTPSRVVYRTDICVPQEQRDAVEERIGAVASLAGHLGIRLQRLALMAASQSEKTNGSRGRGGRKQNNETLARDLLDGWRAYEPEDGRKTKERYLAQRPDVRVLKTEEARQRRIASLRVALDSALHLRREKTKQRRQARG
jgi:hypothetical protein